MTTELTLNQPSELPGQPLAPLSVYSANDLALCSTEEARARLPYESAIKLSVLPIALVQREGEIRIHCVASRDSDELRRSLLFISGLSASISEVEETALREAILKAYRGSDARIREGIERICDVSNRRTVARLPEIPKPQGDAAKFLTTLLEFAIARKASDLHLCPAPDGAYIRLRIDGELLRQTEQHYPRDVHEQIVSRLKVLAGLDIACRRLPQDGAFTFQIGSSTNRVRLSTLPAVDGESAVLRFLYVNTLPQLSMLGIEPATAEIIRRILRKTHGMVLLTGPTGSGKTTTMYSLALELQKYGRNVLSVEDPVEVHLPGMVQVQVHEQHGLDYPRAIRSVLRHDPDVIVIGEMRDQLSARIALTAASTGHLTVSSLHMGSALRALERFRSFEIPSRETAEGISLILSQRLLPKLCDRCKVVDKVGESILRSIVYQSTGCRTCNSTGFDGRVLITEALDLQDHGVKELYGRASSVRKALDTLPSRAHIPWMHALEYHLQRGNISVSQFESFIDEEIGHE